MRSATTFTSSAPPIRGPSWTCSSPQTETNLSRHPQTKLSGYSIPSPASASRGSKVGNQTFGIIILIQATTAIVEKTARAFYSTIAVVSPIAVVCCNLHRRLIAVIECLKLCHIEQKPPQQKELESRIIWWLSEFGEPSLREPCSGVLLTPRKRKRL